MATADKQITYTVRGHWPFPTDMLRHDNSRAASDADQAMIDRLSGEFAPDKDAFEDVDITLVTAWRHNTARWESFGWAIPGDTEHAFYKSLKQAERDRQALVDSALAKLTSDEMHALGLPA